MGSASDLEKRQIVPSFFCNQQEVIFIDFFSLFVKHEKVTVFFADRDAEADENSESAHVSTIVAVAVQMIEQQRAKVKNTEKTFFKGITFPLLLL